MHKAISQLPPSLKREVVDTIYGLHWTMINNSNTLNKC